MSAGAAVVEWFDVTERLPDAEATVLIHVPDDTEPVWMGFTDGEVWFYVDAMTIDNKVTHWAHFPAPPTK